jgi:hypothetical protein
MSLALFLLGNIANFPAETIYNNGERMARSVNGENIGITPAIGENIDGFEYLQLRF